jgi:hypothetical protein
MKFNLMSASIRGLQNFFVFQKQKCDNQRFHKLLPFKKKVWYVSWHVFIDVEKEDN